MHKIVEDLEYESSVKQPSLKKFAGKGKVTDDNYSFMASDETYGFNKISSSEEGQRNKISARRNGSM